MREIKFRAWISKRQTMVQVQSVDFEFTRIFFLDCHDATNSIVGGYVLMQYTGLKDLKGKEIYEGDILHWKGRQYDGSEAPYDIVTSELDFNCSCCDPVYGWYIPKGTETDYEIVGNIYENKELVKKGEQVW